MCNEKEDLLIALHFHSKPTSNTNRSCYTSVSCNIVSYIAKIYMNAKRNSMSAQMRGCTINLVSSTKRINAMERRKYMYTDQSHFTCTTYFPTYCKTTKRVSTSVNLFISFIFAYILYSLENKNQQQFIDQPPFQQ